MSMDSPLIRASSIAVYFFRYNQLKRKALDISAPNKSFEVLIADELEKNLSYDEAMKDVLNMATKIRKSVNKKLGLED